MSFNRVWTPWPCSWSLSPAERLAAQQRDHAAELEVAQGVARGSKRQGARLWWRGPWGARACSSNKPPSLSPFALPLCVAIAACKPLTSLSLFVSTVQHQPQPQLQPLQLTALAVHRQHSQGGSRTQFNSVRALTMCPQTQKFIPRPPQTEIENLLIILKCGPVLIVNERYNMLSIYGSIQSLQ